jgi:NAD dependent epimerase/dehydratase family enzyme
MGEELFLGSQRVEPAKLASSGYQFQHPELKSALKEILQR